MVSRHLYTDLENEYLQQNIIFTSLVFPTPLTYWKEIHWWKWQEPQDSCLTGWLLLPITQRKIPGVKNDPFFVPPDGLHQLQYIHIWVKEPGTCELAEVLESLQRKLTSLSIPPPPPHEKQKHSKSLRFLNWERILISCIPCQPLNFSTRLGHLLFYIVQKYFIK